MKQKNFRIVRKEKPGADAWYEVQELKTRIWPFSSWGVPRVRFYDISEYGIPKSKAIKFTSMRLAEAKLQREFTRFNDREKRAALAKLKAIETVEQTYE